MKKIITTVVFCCISVNVYAKAPTPKELRQITLKSELRFEGQVKTNPKLKKIYDEVMRLFYQELRVSAKEPYSYRFYPYAGKKGIQSMTILTALLKKKLLSRDEAHIIGKAMERELEGHGFFVDYRHFTDSGSSMKISWELRKPVQDVFIKNESVNTH